MLLGAGITAPLIALTKTTQWGWGSARTLGVIAGGLVILVLFGLFERRVKAPLVNMPVFARTAVLGTNIATLLVGFAMFGAFVLIPQIADTPKISGYGFGLGATGAALLLVPGSLIMLAFGPLSGKLLSGGASGRLPGGRPLRSAVIAKTEGGWLCRPAAAGWTRRMRRFRGDVWQMPSAIAWDVSALLRVMPTARARRYSPGA